MSPNVRLQTLSHAYSDMKLMLSPSSILLLRTAYWQPGRGSADLVIMNSIALTLIPVFIFWVGKQEQGGRPAIIPNSLWKRAGFSSVCVATFLTWAMFNSLAFFATLLMQEVQHVSAQQTSLRFLPLVVFSVSANVLAGYLVDKVTASKLAFGATVLRYVVRCYISDRLCAFHFGFKRKTAQSIQCVFFDL